MVFANKTALRDQWEYLRKIERHFSIKQGEPIGFLKELTSHSSVQQWWRIPKQAKMTIFVTKLYTDSLKRCRDKGEIKYTNETDVTRIKF